MVRVTFRKQVSDGSYGTEACEVALEADFNPEVDDDDVIAEALFMEARRLVHAELARSPSANVRRTVGASPTPARAVPAGPAPDVDDEDPEPWR